MGKFNPWRDKLWNLRPHICVYCGRALKWKRNRLDSATVEHLCAVANNGEYKEENLALSCQECNGLKADCGINEMERRMRIAWAEGKPETQRLTMIVNVMRELEWRRHDKH